MGRALEGVGVQEEALLPACWQLLTSIYRSQLGLRVPTPSHPRNTQCSQMGLSPGWGPPAGDSIFLELGYLL